jgi:hypothetical protein
MATKEVRNTEMLRNKISGCTCNTHRGSALEIVVASKTLQPIQVATWTDYEHRVSKQTNKKQKTQT